MFEVLVSTAFFILSACLLWKALTLKKGDKGAKGDTGPMGDPGPKGDRGDCVCVKEEKKKLEEYGFNVTEERLYLLVKDLPHLADDQVAEILGLPIENIPSLRKQVEIKVNHEDGDSDFGEKPDVGYCNRLKGLEEKNEK